MLRAALTAGCLAAGCTGLVRAPGPPPLAGPADSAEYQSYQAAGTLQLGGQVFLSTPTGDVKLGAGRLVTLDPATSYARRWFSRYGADPFRFGVAPPDPSFAAARNTTITDADGRFGFTGLPAGVYLLRSTVTWKDDWADTGIGGGVVAALVSLEADAWDLSLSRWVPPDSAALLVVPILPDSHRPGHTVLAHLTVTTCNSGSPEEVWDERAARARLVMDAARKGADAVSGTVCRKRGLSLTANCVSRIVCEGDAILYQ